jgi:hypothetical protein
MEYLPGSTWNELLHLVCSGFFSSKILTGLDNYEMNTGTMHPFAVTRRELGLEGRGTPLALPLTHGPNSLWIGEISIGTPAKTLKGKSLLVSL